MFRYEKGRDIKLFTLLQCKIYAEMHFNQINKLLAVCSIDYLYLCVTVLQWLIHIYIITCKRKLKFNLSDGKQKGKE